MDITTKEEQVKKQTRETLIRVRDMRNGEWYWIHKKVIEKYGRLIGPYGIAIYNTLACFAHNSSQKAFPSIEKIADLIGCSRRTVVEYLKRLEEIKLIEVERELGRVNVYKLIKVE